MTDQKPTFNFTRKTKLAIAAAAGLLSATALADVAQAGRAHHGYGMVMGMSDRYDANKDGKISQEEIDANRAQWHADFDGDKSGDLTIAEFEKLWLKARREQMVREYQEFDRDGDAKLTLEEYKRPMSDTVMNMDRNGDGLLSRDDRRKRHGPPPQNAQ